MSVQTNTVKPNNLERLIIDLFKSSNSVCLMILGRRDTGKTDLSLLIMETLHKFNVIGEFATNIKVYDPPFHIEYITNLEDLEAWCRSSPNKKLFVLDEAGKSLRRRTPMSALNVRLLDNLQILRKYKLSLILIAPHEKYVDSATLGSDVLDAVIIKPYYRNRKIALYQNLLEDTEIWITEIPPTRLRFNTWDVAPFTKEPPARKPKFRDRQLQILWEWSQGTSHKDLGLHPMQINRLARRFIRETLKQRVHGSHTIAREDNTPLNSSQS